MLSASDDAPYDVVVVLRADHRDGGARFGERGAVEVRRQQAVADQRQGLRVIAVEEEAHHPRWGAGQHRTLLQAVHADAVLDGRAELPGRDRVSVGPHAVLRVVGEVEAGGKRVPVVRTSRVGGRRDGDAVVERQRGVVETPRGELRQDPPVGQLIVQHDRVAGGLRAVVDREAVPQRAERRGPSSSAPDFEYTANSRLTIST